MDINTLYSMVTSLEAKVSHLESELYRVQHDYVEACDDLDERLMELEPKD